MTREEAIKILKAIRVYECYPKSANEETKEAIDMAIEALSAEAEYSKLLQTALNGIPIVDLTDGKTKPSAEIPTESTNTPTNTPTDLISRADAVEAVKKIVPYVIDKDTGQWGILVNKANVITELSALPSADAVDCTDFIEWLLEEVMDEENWHWNAEAYGEIICRKLVKLGVLEVTEEPSYYIRPSADAVCKAHEEEHLKIINRIKELQYAIAKTQTIVGKMVESADAVSDDTQTEERARFVAKETELAHIEARLENAEKRLQGACVANFVAEQLERLKDMTDEERLKLLQTMFPSADATQGEWIPCSERLPNESGEYLATIPLDADETYTEVLTFHKGRFYEDDDEWGATYHDDVLAWMPLPTPYKGGDDE